MNSKRGEKNASHEDTNADRGTGEGSELNAVTRATSFLRPPLQIPPRAQHFTGRQTELDQLLNGLHPGCMITLSGPGGIGKTTLVVEVLWTLVPGDDLPERFPDGIIYHDFNLQPHTDLALETIVRAYGEEPRPTLVDAAWRVLSDRRVLIVLDGAENASDLDAILAIAGNCGLLVASRTWRDTSVMDRGIAPLPNSEAALLLQAWAGSCAFDEIVARRMCELLGDLPLAVRLAGCYLSQCHEEAADYLAWLESTPLTELDGAARQRDGAWLILEKSASRLDESAYPVLAVAGQLAPAPFSREAIAAALKMTSDDAGRFLDEWASLGLLLKHEGRYQISHPLIHSYARQHAILPEKASRRLAGFYATLTENQDASATPDDAVLDAERPHIFATMSSCVAGEDWDQTLRIARAVDEYLERKDRWTERITALKAGVAAAKALDRRHAEATFLGTLGLVYRRFGQSERALQHHQQALSLYRELGNAAAEGNTLSNMGLVLADMGRLERAIEFHEAALSIHRGLGDRRAMGAHLGNMGIAFYSSGDLKRAIDHYEQALSIAREISDRRAELNRLSNIGLAYRHLGEIHWAIEYYQTALTIARELRDRRREGAIQGNLGNAHADLGAHEQALECYIESLFIARETGHRRNEGRQLANVGDVYYSLERLDQAVECYEAALAISREIGDRHYEGEWAASLGTAYHSQGQLDHAIEFYAVALDIAYRTGDRHGEVRDLRNLGLAHIDVGRLNQAGEYLKAALEVARDLGDRRCEAKILSNLGYICAELGLVDADRDHPGAIGHYREALAIHRELDDRHAEALDSWNLGLLYEEHNPVLALELMSVLVAYEREMDHPDADADAERLAQVRARL